MLRAVLRSDFSSFIAKNFATVNPGQPFHPNWHIDLIAEYLEAVRRGDLKRLIINMPPRALKSVCVSVAFPAWLLGHKPENRVIVASYALPLALKHSLDTREVMRAAWFRELFPACRIARGQDEKHKFITTARGFRLSTSTGAGLTGEGGNVLIIDDPLTPEQALQPHLRAATNAWFEHTFASRLDSKQDGAIVLVMQRLHPQDLAGNLLEKGGWEQLSLPAIADVPTTYSFGKIKYARESGEVLCGTRESPALYEHLKIEMGSHVFAAQYQQQPVPQEGCIIKPHWVRYAETVPAGTIVQSWDTAIKTGAANDSSVCLTAVLHEQCLYVIDVQLMKLEYPDLKRAVVAQAEKHTPDIILLEDKASGQQLIQDLRKHSSLPIVPCSPKSDKRTRVHAVSALIEAGRLFLITRAPWLAAFEAELFQFPACVHDDQVDALTQALQWLRSRPAGPASVRTI